MITYNTTLKKLPKDVKFATYNEDNKDIILGEYLIATLIYNGESLDKILKSADEIEDKKERESVKKVMSTIFLNFIELNPKFYEFIKKHTTQSPKEFYISSN